MDWAEIRQFSSAPGAQKAELRLKPRPQRKRRAIADLHLKKRAATWRRDNSNRNTKLKRKIWITTHPCEHT
jgi:hypothetical protein